MRYVYAVILLIVMSFPSLVQGKHSQFLENRESLIQKVKKSKKITKIDNYQFTQKNRDDFKFFLNKTIDVLLGENIYSV
ncbi:hypothetical protein, partial [Aggregatibacter actinomycetemcomitans]